MEPKRLTQHFLNWSKVFISYTIAIPDLIWGTGLYWGFSLKSFSQKGPRLHLPKFPAIVFVLLFMISCGPEEVVVKEPPPKEDPWLARSEAWAKGRLSEMSLAEKVGQLVMVTPPDWKGKSNGKSISEEELAAFTKEMKQLHIGGLLLSDEDRESQRLLAYQINQDLESPVWVALDAGQEWAESRGYPSIQSLGAVHSDKLAYAWGMAIGNECRYLGGHIVFTSAPTILSDPLYTDAISSDPERSQLLSKALVHGLTDAPVIPCVRFLPGLETHDPESSDLFPGNDKVPDSLKIHEIAPVKALVEEQIGALALEHFAISAIDSFPVSLSSSIQQEMLRHELNYQGLIFSPTFQDSLFFNGFTPGEAEVMAIGAGTDMIVAPSELEATLVKLVESVKGGVIAEKDLDERVYRHLLKKALLGLDTFAVPHPDSILTHAPQVRLEELNRSITASSLTILRDEPGRLPLKKVATTKIATLSIGPGSRTNMQRSLDLYANMDHFYLKHGADSAKYAAMLKRLKKYNYAIVGIYPEVCQPDSGGRLSQPTLEFLHRLKDYTRPVIANFCPPTVLPDLDTLQVLVHAYDERRLTQRAMAQLIFGADTSNATLPYSVDTLFTTGTGIPQNKKLRLSYCDPEDLGIDPANLKPIDSILYGAIRLGTFPGCQVLAAKDGKVFFNKAYGYHDYDRVERVNLDDVYDIASVTKIAATTLMAMWSFDQDSLQLNAPIKDYLEELDSSFITIKDITPEELLIHKAGLPSGLPIYKYYTFVDSVDSVRTQIYSASRDSLHDLQIADELFINATILDTMWERIRMVKLPTRGTYKYSDMSMFLLKRVLERIHDTELDRFVRTNFYGPMGLKSIGYHPLDRFEEDDVVPTEKDRWWRKQILHGFVHDESTAIFGGVGGQAGLFSNTRDLAVLMQMLLNEGAYGGTRYISRGTVRKFTSRHPNSHRGLGFDMQKSVPQHDRGMCCFSASPTTFGHTGFTGTCAWADPDTDVIFIFLSNRVYPDRKNKKINIYRVRQNVQQVVYNALGLDLPPEGICVPEDEELIYLAERDSVGVDSLGNVIFAGDSIGIDSSGNIIYEEDPDVVAGTQLNP